MANLCHSNDSPCPLVYSTKDRNDHELVYKYTGGDWTTISFAWGSDGKDLDICAYWDGASDMKVGFDYDTSTQERIKNEYHIFYSGDEQATGASEWVKIKMKPWSSGNPRTFKVHFNFFKYNAEEFPASTCNVVASQKNGPTLILTDVSCGTSYEQPAKTSDPGVVVTFDTDGVLTSMELL